MQSSVILFCTLAFFTATLSGELAGGCPDVGRLPDIHTFANDLTDRSLSNICTGGVHPATAAYKYLTGEIRGFYKEEMGDLNSAWKITKKEIKGAPVVVISSTPLGALILHMNHLETPQEKLFRSGIAMGSSAIQAGKFFLKFNSDPVYQAEVVAKLIEGLGAYLGQTHEQMKKMPCDVLIGKIGETIGRIGYEGFVTILFTLATTEIGGVGGEAKLAKLVGDIEKTDPEAARFLTALKTQLNDGLIVEEGAVDLKSANLRFLRKGSEHSVYLWERPEGKIAVRTLTEPQSMSVSVLDQKIDDEVTAIKKLEKYGGPKVEGTTRVDGKKAMKMEYLDGDPLDKTEHVTRQQCVQMQAIIERSVKDGALLSDVTNPENIILTKTGEVRLIDSEVTSNVGAQAMQNRWAYAHFIEKGGNNCLFLQPLLDEANSNLLP